MEFPSIIHSTAFYHHFLPNIKAEKQKEIFLDKIISLQSALQEFQKYMVEYDIHFPQYFSYLKHSIKMLQIYRVDVENLSI